MKRLQFIFSNVKLLILKSQILFVLLLMIPVSAFSQYKPTIQSDRPGQANSPHSVGRPVFQIQSGVNYNRVVGDIANAHVYTQGNVFRYGIAERFDVEAGLATGHLADRSGQNVTGISSSALGVRYNIIDESNDWPALGVQGRILLPFNASGFPAQTGGQVVLSAGKNAGDHLTLTTNWGLTFYEDGSTDGLYVLNGAYSINEAVSVFAELYGNLSPWDVNFDAGIAYLLTNDLQFDFSAGLQEAGANLNGFVDGGVSYRLGR